MLDTHQITKAIGAHGMWRMQLETAIRDGRLDRLPETVQVDNLCDFGRWLYSLSPADRESEQYKKVQDIHAQFHVEAANVLNLAMAGQKADAAQAMAPASRFGRLATELTLAMVDWKKAIGG